MKETKPILANGKPIGNGTLPIVITPLVGKTQAAILDEVAAIIPKAPDLLEWRIDFFEAIGNTQAVIDESSWQWPDVFNWLQQAGNRHHGERLSRARPVAGACVAC